MKTYPLLNRETSRRSTSAELLVPLLLGCFAFSAATQAAPRPSPTPGIQDVNVVNTPTVSDADNPARQSFQASVIGHFTTDTEIYVPITTVPAGKRLIIEHVSMVGFVQTGERIYTAAIAVANNNSNPVGYFLTISPQGTDGTYDFYNASEQVRLYADAGTQVFVDAQAPAEA
jgi:hypothetical protein